MNSDIKNGARQLVKGLRTEARDISLKIASKFDEDGNGKIDFLEMKKEVVGNAKDGVDKLKAVVQDEELPQKAKEEINKAIDKIKPMVEAAKMDAEIKKEKILAEIEQKKRVEQMKADVAEEAASIVENDKEDSTPME